MPNFSKKQISRGQTLADQFRKTRLSQGISLAEAQAATKIQIKYLEILENGNYQDLPGEIYAKAWVRIYAEFLGLTVKSALIGYGLEKKIATQIKSLEQNKKIPERRIKRNFLSPRLLKISSLALISLALVIYLASEINNIMTSPTIKILEPLNGAKTTASSIVIKGQTIPEVQLLINGELVLLDEQGYFEQEINLAIGLNNLQISAKKKHSRTANLELNILRELIK